MPETTEGTEDAATPEPAAPATPTFSIVDKHATPEEIAAIVAIFSALHTPAAPPPRPAPEWSQHHRKLRRTPPHGPGGWRSSALPR
jgi:acyl-CoA carboxylase epsilon subunit